MPEREERPAGAEHHVLDTEDAAPDSLDIRGLVKRFDRLYSEAKRTINCLDFADLEHQALKLLSAEDSSEQELTPSQAALALRHKYRYIFVDEYQDINGVQQAILDLLSAGGNVFVVGDAKQSIYAWRGAEPDIFINQLRQASRDAADSTGRLRVDLNTNFRSAEGILDFVNKIFGRIMSARFGRIDYDESAMLRSDPANKARGPRGDAGDANVASAYAQVNEQTWVSGIEASQRGDQTIWEVSVTDPGVAEDPLLSLLVSAGCRVADFGPKESNLEDVFLKIVEGSQK